VVRAGMLAAVLVLSVGWHAEAQMRPVSTYSIVAYDPKTGELGVAVQSHWFSVGQIVSWAEAGVGAVATQSFADPSYGQLGLDLMRAGRGAPDTLRGLLAADEGRELRQVAMVDARGRVGSHTGTRNIQAAGHQQGAHYSVQANLMGNARVWPAMAAAFEGAPGDLAERMLAALDAAEAAGGDIRGRQSAALVVVSGKPTGRPWQGRVFDLRVDDHAEPLRELRRLVATQRAYNHMNAGDLAVEHKEHERARQEYAAAEKLLSTTQGVPATRLAEAHFWHAVALVNMNRVEEAVPVFARAFAIHPPWRDLVPRLQTAGLLPDDRALVDRITGGR
jgi:uncharacterized Ntn-hydrolase superfamily protein